MGVPRSVGDFFTWGPTETIEIKYKVRIQGPRISFGGGGGGGGGRGRGLEEGEEKLFIMGAEADEEGNGGAWTISAPKSNNFLPFVIKDSGHRTLQLDVNSYYSSASSSLGLSSSPTNLRWASVNVTSPLQSVNLIPEVSAHIGVFFTVPEPEKPLSQIKMRLSIPAIVYNFEIRPIQ